jgi:hypothetical protein
MCDKHECDCCRSIGPGVVDAANWDRNDEQLELTKRDIRKMIKELADKERENKDRVK